MKRRRRVVTPESVRREAGYQAPPSATVEGWRRTEAQNKIRIARLEAERLEREMRRLVATVEPVIDPNALLNHPRIGLELRRLSREWIKARAIVWRIEAGKP